MHIVIAFPWSRSKEIVKHPEQIAAGGIWSIVHAMRSIGEQVSLVNLYDENDKFNDHRAVQQFQDILNVSSPEKLIVFDFGNSRVDWRSAHRKTANMQLVYHAGDDPMRYDANRASIKETNYDFLMTAQKPFVEKYMAEFETITGWVPYWTDNLLHYQVFGAKKIFDVVHCGKIYGLRQPILEAMASSGISVKHEFQFGHAYRSLLSKSKIGFHHAWCGEVGYRHFEVAAMGLPLVCDELDPSYGLRDLLGDEPFYYDGKTDEEKIANCVKVTKELLANIEAPEVSKRIKTLRDNVLKDHTSFQRAILIRDILKTSNTIGYDHD